MTEDELNALKAQAEETLQNCNSKLDEISSKVDRATALEENIKLLQSQIEIVKSASEAAKAAIEGIKNTSETTSQSISSAFNQVQQASAKVEELYNQSSAQYGQITEAVNSVGGKINSIETFYPNFEVLKAKVEDTENGLGATFNKSIEYLESLKNHKENARVAQEDVLSNKLKAEQATSDIITTKEEILTTRNESVELKDKISNILNLVTNTGLANSFDERRKRSQKSVMFWGIAIAASVILGILLICSIFLWNKTDVFSSINNDYVKFLLRITLTSPIVFFIWFSSSQFSKERYILEQYEFKTAAALALENYTQLLKSNYPEKGNEIFELVVELIKKVYRAPVYAKDRSLSDVNAKVKIPQTEVEGEFSLTTK